MISSSALASKKMEPASKLKPKRLNLVDVTAKEEHKLRGISSGISQLRLDETGLDILDKFDSSLLSPSRNKSDRICYLLLYGERNPSSRKKT